jgi:hypothetical protein
LAGKEFINFSVFFEKDGVENFQIFVGPSEEMY